MDPIITFVKASEALDLAEGVVEGTIETGVLQTKVNEKLVALETQYAPRLTSAESQLADIVTVNIKNKGAKNDGTDCRLAIQQAIDEVGQSGGGVVWIPKGVFEISLDTNHNGLKISYSNVKITGEGTIKLKDNQLSGSLAFSPCMILVDTLTSNETDTIENVTIENITINQNRENNFCTYVGYSADAVTVRHCINARIENVKIKDVIDSAIMFTSNKRSKIINNRIETGYRYCKVNTTVGSTTITSITANFTSKDVGKYIAIKKASSDGSTVFGATVASVVDSNTATLNLQNNTVAVAVTDADALICNSDSGIYVSDFRLDSTDSPVPFSSENTRGDRTEEIIVSGNTINGFQTGMHCNRGTSRMILTDNTVKHSHIGMDLSFETVEFTAIPQKNIVSNNTFETCYRIAMGLSNAHFSIIANNRITDAAIGIDLAGTSYSVVADNIIIGDLNPSSYHMGISIGRGFKDNVETFASYNSITGNIVSKFWIGVKDNASCEGNVYSANQLKWNRDQTNTSNLYTLSSGYYCLDGVWSFDSSSGKVFPVLKGTTIFEGGKLRIYDGTNYRTLSNYRSIVNAANATTINGLDATFVMLNNYSVATSVTAITNGEVGQELTLYMTNANVTLVNSNNLRLSGNVNYTPPSKTAMKFVCLDGTIWAEVSRITQG